jgi:hypothetical protein
LVDCYAQEPVSKILLGSAFEAVNPAGYFEKDGRSYVFSNFFVKEPVDAKSENTLIVKLVEPA